MKLLNINFILLFCFIQQLAFSQSLNENIISIYSKNPKDNTSKQWYVESIGDTVYTLGSYGIRAYDYKDKYNPYLMIENEEPSSYMKWARSLCGGDDVLFVATRQATGGKTESFTPDFRFRFENRVKDFTKNTGDFDNYICDGGIKVDELGERDWNFGHNSLCLVSNSQGYAILEKEGDNVNLQKWGSFWIKVHSLQNSDIVIPLRRNDMNENVFSITISPKSDDKYRISLSNSTLENNIDEFEISEWYNVKFYVDNNTSKLWWRTKECGDWSLLQEGTGIKEFNKISVGLITTESGDSVLIDDYYCHSTDIDNVSYVNGSLEVLDKKTLNIIKKLNSDIKFVQSKKVDSVLVVSGLWGFNLYNIMDEKNPELLYTYRTPSYKEFQGFDIFKENGKTYIVFSIYSVGISLWDISNPKKPSLVKEIKFSDVNVTNYNLPAANKFTFDLFVDYPYVYSTLSVKSQLFKTEDDCRGMIVYDISDMQNITAKVYPINKDDLCYTVTADPSPTDVRRQGYFIFINMAERGLGVYKMEDEGELTYLGLTRIYNGKAIKAFDVTDDAIYVCAYKGDALFCVNNEFIDEASIIISETGEGTYCSNHDLDFTEVSGLKAYIASGFFQNTGTVLLTRVYDVPAYTGIMVKGEPGTYTVPFSTSYAYYSNMLKGNVESTTIYPTDGEYCNYYLSNGENGLGFYKVNESKTMSANRAYLQLPSTMENEARSIRLVYTEDDLTGINELSESKGNGEKDDDVIYDMQGRRVSHPTKGMYIKNGKKMVIEK